MAHPKPAVRIVRQLALLGPRAQGWLAFAVYLTVSLLFFGIPVIGDFSGSYVGIGGTDEKFFMWCLRYWPHVILEGRNPFLTDLVWAPTGYNITWATAIPGLSLILSPITLIFGNVVSFNIVAIAAPAFASTTAYLLARHVTRAFWPSLLGGYLFGFSTYMLGQLHGHLNLSFVALVPLSVYLVLRHLDRSLSSRRFVVFLTLVLVGQFLISTEVFFTVTLFGGVVVAVALALAEADQRRNLLVTTALVGAAYAMTGVLVSPYLYYFFLHGPRPPIRNHASSDLLAFVIPRENTLLHTNMFDFVTDRFGANLTEDGTYVGLPGLLLAGGFLLTERRRTVAKLLGISLLVVTVASLGPRLKVAGGRAFPLPWAAIDELPLVTYVLTVRLSMYVSLILALMAAIWLSAGRSARRWLVAGSVLVFLLPNLPSGMWHAGVEMPDFIASGAYRTHVAPREIVLFVPSGEGKPMLWQASTAMYFRMTGAETGAEPPEFWDSPIARKLHRGRLRVTDLEDLRVYVSTHQVGSILIEEDGARGRRLIPVLDLFGWTRTRTGGMVLYQPPGTGAT
jgi:hypothetical protein